MKSRWVAAGCASCLAFVAGHALGNLPAPPVVLPQVRNAGGATVPSQAVVLIDATGAERGSDNPLPTLAAPLQESLQLATANAATAPVTTYGGGYIYSQTCDAYGSVNLEVRGPDGATWQTIATMTQSDTTGGQMIQLGSKSVIRVELAGTTNCAATLSRVPA